MGYALTQHRIFPLALFAGLAALTGFACSSSDDSDGDPSQSTTGGTTSSGGTSSSGGTTTSSGGATGGTTTADTCKADKECESGEVCQFGKCHEAACSKDEDCGAGRVCDAGRCGIASCDPDALAFSFTPSEGSEPTTVHLAGTFNSWTPGEWALTKKEDGSWSGSFDVDPGQHQYKFVIDAGTEAEDWVFDAAVAAWAPDGFGGKNSLIGVSCEGLVPVEVECSQDGDCDGGKICQVISCVEPECTADDDCDAAEVCTSGRCEAAPGDCSVSFDFDSGETTHSSVSVAGSFNEWNATAWPLVLEGTHWKGSFGLGEGEYAYKVVLDGVTWILDPSGADTVDDGFGGLNTKLSVDCGLGGAGGEGGGAP